MSEHVEDDVAGIMHFLNSKVYLVNIWWDYLFEILLSCTVVSETAQKNFENLQAQISAVVISEGDLKNKLLGPDTIIS